MKKYNDYSFPEHIKGIAEMYVKYKRSLGFKCPYHEQRSICAMIQFIRERSTDKSPYAITAETAYSYANGSGSQQPRTTHLKQSLIRQYGLFLKLQGIDAYVLPKGLIKTSSGFAPYIFTKNEISAILVQADKIGPNRNKFVNTPYVYPAIIRILYGCGLRVSETLSLLCEHVSLDNGVITIDQGKNNASRLVPMSDSLWAYLLYYDGIVQRGNNPYFIPALHGEHYSSRTILNTFRVLLKKAGIGPLSNGAYPRIHDLRHTFCVHAFEQMISKGMDPYCALPILSTYVGHKGIESTEIYIRLTKQYFINVLKYSEVDASMIFPEVTMK